MKRKCLKFTSTTSCWDVQITNARKIVIVMSQILCSVTGLGILVLKAKLDITLEDLQKGPVFLSLAYKGTFFWLAVPGTQNLPGRWGLKTTHYLPLLSLLVTVSKHLLFIITYTQVKNKSNWLYCYNYSQQDILALCTRPENFVLLPIDCVWNEGFWILQTPVPRCIIFWWGTAESYRVMLLLVHTCLLVGTQKILKTFSWIHLCDEIPLWIRLCENNNEQKSKIFFWCAGNFLLHLLFCHITLFWCELELGRCQVSGNLTNLSFAHF